MLFIVLGHLWVHVSATRPWPIISGDSVAVFLLLSGMGSTVSYIRKHPPVGAYISGRIRRVMTPYWATTVLFLALDLIFLGRTLGWFDIAMTMFGINMDEPTRLFDYVRWYVTFQLFWYAAFLLAVTRFEPKRAGLALILAAPVLLLLDYYVLPLGWSKYLAFPAGCLLGAWYPEAVAWLRRRRTLVAVAIPVLLCVFLGVKFALAHGVTAGLPSIVRLFVVEGDSLVLAALLLAAFIKLGEAGLYSRFLEFTGRYSYEIFLLHGPFLVKYNPFFALTTDLGLPVAVSFLLLLAFVMGAAWMLQRILRYAHL